MNDSAGFGPQGLSRPQDVLEETLPVVVLLLVVLATLLRIFHLGAQSLWIDELLTIDQGRMVGHGLWEQFLDDFQTPLPMLIVSGLGRVTTAEAWLRLPGAVLGILTIPVFLDVVRHYLDRRGAVLAALMLCIHPMHIAHCQEVRGYAYLVFFALAATSVALRDRQPWRPLRWLGVVVLGVAATLSNLQGLFWMAGLGLLVAVGRGTPRSLWPRHLSAFVMIAILTSPWWLRSLGVIEVARVIPGESVGEPLRGASTASVWSLPYAGFVLSFGKTLGPSAAALHNLFAGEGSLMSRLGEMGTAQWILNGAAAVVVAWLAVVGWLRLGRRRWELLLWALPVLAIAALLAVRNVKPFNPRYVIALLPVVLIVAAAALASLPRRAALLGMLVWLALTGVSLKRYYFDPEHAHADLRGAARLVAEREGDSDAILAPTIDRVFAFYYRGHSQVEAAYGEDFVSEEAMLSRAAAVDPQARFLWYVESRRWYADPESRFPAALGGRYRQLSEFRVPGVRMLLFDRTQAPGGER